MGYEFSHATLDCFCHRRKRSRRRVAQLPNERVVFQQQFELCGDGERTNLLLDCCVNFVELDGGSAHDFLNFAPNTPLLIGREGELAVDRFFERDGYEQQEFDGTWCHRRAQIVLNVDSNGGKTLLGQPLLESDQRRRLAGTPEARKKLVGWAGCEVDGVEEDIDGVVTEHGVVFEDPYVFAGGF